LRLGKGVLRSEFICATKPDAEHIKQAHQAQMIGLIASAMDAIVMLDDAQSIIAFNPSAEKMFGYARADILGSQARRLGHARRLQRC